jgi:N-acetylneuraminic acid mutarotase
VLRRIWCAKGDENAMNQQNGRDLVSLTTFAMVFAPWTLAASSPTALAENERDASRAYVMETTTLMPEAIASFGAAVANDWLYVYGGHVGQTHQHSTANLSQSFRRLNLLDRTSWEDLPPARPLQGVTIVSHTGRVYRIGGMSAHNRAGEPEQLASVADFACFDPSTRAWQDLPPLPEPRSSHDAAILGDRLYVVGGWNHRDGEENWHTTAHAIDLASASPHWEAMPAPPFQRRALAVAAADGKLFVLGGLTPQRRRCREVNIFDPQTGAWSRGPQLPMDGFGVSAVGIGRKLYVSGMDGNVYALDAGMDRWERVETLVFPRYLHRLVALGESQLAALGGAAPRAGHLRSIEWIELADRPERPQLWSWVIPFPGDAKNRQGIFLKGSELFVFGGNNSLAQHDFEPKNFLSEAYRISLETMTVSPLADFPVRRQSMQTAIMDDAGFAVGGFGHDGQTARTWGEVLRYDFDADRWSQLAARLPEPRTQFGLVQHEERLWVFGGLDFDRRREDSAFHHPLEVLSWNPREDNATFMPTSYRLPRPRRAFGGALLDNRYYLVGGLREDFATVEACDVFDFDTLDWTSIPSPARPLISSELVALGGRLYLAGGAVPTGRREAEPNQSLEVYDPQTRRWTTLIENLPMSTRHMRMFALRDRLLLYSAYDVGTKAVHLLIIEPQ